MTGRTTLLGSAAVAVLAAPLLLVGLLLTITTTTMSPGAALAAINVDALPPLARQLLRFQRNPLDHGLRRGR